LLALLLAAPAAQAQISTDLIMENYNSNVSVITTGIINKSMMDNAIARNNAGRSGSTRSAGRNITAARTTASTSTAYTPTSTLRQQTVQGYINRLKTSNPAGAQAIAENFGPGKYDYSKIYRDLTQDVGLRENDAGDVLATYLILGWMIVNNVQDDKAVTAPMARGVRDQVAPLLANNAQVRTRAAQVGEEMKLQTVVVHSGWQSAIKEGKLAAYRQGIGNLFKTQYSMDLSQFKVTNQGFAKR
jgi:hypothetical protein